MTPPNDAAESAGAARGVAVATVADNEDPRDLGRVKLRFPWRENDDESRWAPIAAPMAGEESGTYFLPETGDQVLVAFERGDFHYPVVLGSLWNDDQQPPATNEGDNDVRRVRSRAGHEVTFDDADDGGVEIRTDAGHAVLLDDEQGSESVTVEDSSGENAIEFDPNAGSLTVEASASVAIEAPSIELSADGNLAIESGGTLTLDGAVITLN